MSIGKESPLIRTFGENAAKLCEDEIVQVGIRTPSRQIVYDRTFSVPVICRSISLFIVQMIPLEWRNYQTVQMLIAAVYYWSLVVNGTVVQGKTSEPVTFVKS